MPWLFARGLCGDVTDARTAAAGKPGDKVLFEDTIREVVVKESGTIFLNFGAAYPDEVMAAVVMKETHPRFPDVETWNGRKVRVEGEICDFEGHHRIILRERGQILLVSD